MDAPATLCLDSSYQVFGIAFSYALHILTALHLKKKRYLDNGGKGATAGYGPMKGQSLALAAMDSMGH